METTAKDLRVNDLSIAGARALGRVQAIRGGRRIPGHCGHGHGCLAVSGPSSGEAGDTGTGRSPGSLPCRHANPTALSSTARFRLASSGKGRDRTPLAQPRELSGNRRERAGRPGAGDGPSAEQGAKAHTGADRSITERGTRDRRRPRRLHSHDRCSHPPRRAGNTLCPLPFKRKDGQGSANVLHTNEREI